MSYVMVDVESDGPIPGDYSMICIGAVIVEAALSRTFYGKLRPISERWVPEALAISGFSREDTVAFDNPCDVMACFERWIKENTNGRPIMITDNAGYDWQFVNWYFNHFLGRNPLGYSAVDLGSLYKGVARDMFTSFKHLVKTPHTHNPVDDAKGNAEALLSMKAELGLRISLKNSRVCRKIGFGSKVVRYEK